jgi:toxin ParE1/3/4
VSRIRLITTPRAQRDIDEHALFIARENLDAGLRFLDAIDRARTELARHPEIGAPRRFDSPTLSSLRVWPIPRFEHWLIFYRVDDSKLTVIRVLHGARDIPNILEE